MFHVAFSVFWSRRMAFRHRPSTTTKSTTRKNERNSPSDANQSPRSRETYSFWHIRTRRLNPNRNGIENIVLCSTIPQSSYHSLLLAFRCCCCCHFFLWLLLLLRVASNGWRWLCSQCHHIDGENFYWNSLYLVWFGFVVISLQSPLVSANGKIVQFPPSETKRNEQRNRREIGTTGAHNVNITKSISIGEWFECAAQSPCIIHSVHSRLGWCNGDEL